MGGVKSDDLDVSHMEGVFCERPEAALAAGLILFLRNNEHAPSANAGLHSESFWANPAFVASPIALRRVVDAIFPQLAAG